MAAKAEQIRVIQFLVKEITAETLVEMVLRITPSAVVVAPVEMAVILQVKVREDQAAQQIATQFLVAQQLVPESILAVRIIFQGVAAADATTAQILALELAAGMALDITIRQELVL